MDNTNKKQPMTDEELSKISGGFLPPDGLCSCPYCGNRYWAGDSHVSRCINNPNNPNSPYYIGR